MSDTDSVRTRTRSRSGPRPLGRGYQPQPTPRRRRVALIILLLLLGAGFSGASSVLADTADDHRRARVLLLSYHASIEHDVLLSHLCVQRCTKSAGCPEEIRTLGADFWSDDFIVFRPAYLGKDARFVINAYKDKDIDFLSISGHHASGFSGEVGKGSWDTNRLNESVEGLAGAENFFSTPSFVLLQGCWTDVKSGFVGDPIEYVRHIIEDTRVRPGESQRLLAAIQQIAGEDDAYRDLFPNACILGYRGTQVPGGLFEIYGQVNGFLRGVRGVVDGDAGPAALFPLREARRDARRMDEVNRAIDRQCRTGWPCNLCAADAAHYGPLASGLATALRSERRRLHALRRARGGAESERFEEAFEAASFYANTSWSCSAGDPSTPPVFPTPIDRAPFVETFLELLMVDLGAIRGDSRHRIEAELVHLLGNTELDPPTRARLLDRLDGTADLDAGDPGPGVTWRRTFVRDVIPTLSSFRQRDFFDFLAEIGCRRCFEEVFRSDLPRVVRENAAAELQPQVGDVPYRLALTDDSARVRWLAAGQLHVQLPKSLFDQAWADDDERVREAATASWYDTPPYRTLAPDPEAP